MRTTDEILAASACVRRGIDCARAAYGDGWVHGDRWLPTVRCLLHDADHGIDRGLRGGPPAEPGRPRVQFFSDLLRRYHDVFRHWRHDTEHCRAGIGRILWEAASQKNDRETGKSFHR